MTLPTVAPMPQWTSGIAATWLCTIGSDATLRSCWIAFGSAWTPRIQALIGTPCVSTVSWLLTGRRGVGPRDRLRKYLARFGLTHAAVIGATDG
jgi:hypothetical protein